jgi:hypothetical protein
MDINSDSRADCYSTKVFVRALLMKTSRTSLSIVLASGLAACTTMGTGIGSTNEGDIRAVLTWESRGDRTGTMTAMLSNGDTYTGTYFQITEETRVDSLGPLWVGWNPWPGWPYWDAGPQFITYYTGRVVANLQGPGGRRMRCTFQLIRPPSGMAGGGLGQCQLPNGETIETTFPPAA